ncbi:nickel pincer cofactor biosynthesis protein LarC [Desulfitobacterium sp. AusDCA]|uniref:nickel pincer cofactor biosynthesis protein LarC n=1 Tax=Desulfitobacterium sp. AusDCA TaxID=3240383 RepID=UPI003DA74BCA
MRIAYFDCFAGISGDMTLGALVDAGLNFEELKAELAKLHLKDYEIKQEKVVKQGMSGTKIHVLAQEGHVHRHLNDITQIIQESELAEEIKDKALAVFGKLAEAEARVHGTSPQEVHFHEVGAVDAIVDIVGAVIGLYRLGIEKVYASAVHTGQGFTKAAHGTIPIPAPATIELLQGIPVYTQNIPFELVTPTGAAILSTYCSDFGDMPVMKVDHIGYGAGERDLTIPNLLRIMIGEKSTMDIPKINPNSDYSPEPLENHECGQEKHIHEHKHEHADMHEQEHKHVHEHNHNHNHNHNRLQGLTINHNSEILPQGEARFLQEQTIQAGEALMLEANIDDMNPEFYDYLIQKFFKEGAMDVFLQPIQMKKNRPAVTLSVQIHPSQLEKFTTLILKETTTIGVRVYPVTKYMLPYEVIPVDTPWGEAKAKIVRAGGEFTTISPEYEDCRRIAEKENLPLKEIYEEIKKQASREKP